MILTCPECATRYAVPQGSVGPEGRTVRCANCGASWRARSDEVLDLGSAGAPVHDASPAPAFSPETPGEALPRAYREKVEARKQATRAAAVGVIAAVGAVILLALLATAVVFRADVVRAWPGSAGAFAAMGLPVNVTGLVFEEVSAQPDLRDGRALVRVSGLIRNVTERTLVPPPVRAALLDGRGRELAITVGAPDRSSVPAGETRRFELLLADPPSTAAEVDVSFMLDDQGRPAPAPRRAGAVPTTPRLSPAPAAPRPLQTPAPPPLPEPVEAQPLPSATPDAPSSTFADPAE